MKKCECSHDIEFHINHENLEEIFISVMNALPALQRSRNTKVKELVADVKMVLQA